MDLLERQYPAQRTPSTAGPQSGADSDSLRQEAQQAWQAADAALERALSGDSRAFLDASQQRGGQ
jgi:hypothetical protein